MFKHVTHRVPVTALAYLDESVILAGEGSYLTAYDVRTKQKIRSLDVLPQQSIHGILVLDRNRILAWGGRIVVSLETAFTSTGLNAITKTCIFHLQDWILDIAASPGESPHDTGHCILAAVTAHNALALLSSSQAFKFSDTPVEVENAVSGSNCILYSSQAAWLDSTRCLVASGTAFGDIILGSCLVQESDSGGLLVEWQMHYNFSAHEGSLFGINISPPLDNNILGKCTRALASCSDDRTICVWDISDLPTAMQSASGTVRDTGFGSEKDKTTNAPALLAKAMGHVSRIWHVRFCMELQPSLQLRSYGEDASVVTWLLTDTYPHDLPITLQQVDVETAHIGKHIWSVADHVSTCFATGGADGAIALRKHVQTSETALSGTSHSGLFSSHPLRAYNFIDGNNLFITHDDGRVSVLDTDTNKPSVEVSKPISGLKGYSIVATVGADGFAAGADGSIYWYIAQTRELRKFAQTESKVGGLFAATLSSPESHGLSVLAYTLSPPTLLLYDIADCGSDLLQPIKLQPTSNLVPTSFTLSVSDGSAKYAVVGSRKGGVTFFEITSQIHHTNNGVTVEGLHTGEAVTSLLWHPNVSNGNLVGFLHSTGRDGYHCILAVKRDPHGLQADLVHRLALPFGPNIERCAVAPNTTSLWVWGFKSKDFIVYDLTLQREIMRVECGGAHRNWAFQPISQGGTFIWTKAGKVYKHTQTDLPFELIDAGGHGREIKSIAITDAEPKIIATGSEDTDIKLFTSNEKGEPTCLQTLRKHNTGIQHLQWSSRLPNGQTLLFSSGGFEEFFVWTITPSIPSVGIGVLCEASHPHSSKSDLRIMSFEATPINPIGVEWEITMAYSDSTLKKWHYTRPDSWSLTQQADYLTSCLTSTLSLPSTRITTSTDGHITLWSPDLTLKSRHQAHQNAILSTTSFPLHNGGSMLVTGGDDNAISLTRFERRGVKTLRIPRAHAAAITGLVYLPDPSAETGRVRGWVVSVSIDQLVKLWRVDVDTAKEGVEGMRVERVGKGYTSVADVCGVEVLWRKGREVRVVIAGVGVGFWDITLP